MNARYIHLWLTCADAREANVIAASLLKKRLAACVKHVAIGSDFLWKGEVDHNNETLLIMDSREDLFDEVEAEVKKMHSYETFVLQAVPILKTSYEAEKWLSGTLKKGQT